MTRRKTKIKPAAPDVVDPHEELGRYAVLIVEDLIPSMANRFDLCLGCFAVEIMQQLQDALTTLQAHQEADDKIGSTKGSA